MIAACVFIALISTHFKLASATTPIPSSTQGTTEYTELPFTDPAIMGCCVYKRVPGDKLPIDSKISTNIFQAVIRWLGCTPCTGARQSYFQSVCELMHILWEVYCWIKKTLNIIAVTRVFTRRWETRTLLTSTASKVMGLSTTR